MPPIPAEFLDSVVYLYPNREAAEKGERIGGSGFVASMYFGGEGEYPRGRYIVTNRHVAERATVARLSTYQGVTELFDTPAGGWHHHPDGDDVSVFPLLLPPREALRFGAIPESTFVSMPNAVEAGDDVFILGRFVSVEGKQKNAPVARFGHVAMRGTQRVATSRHIDQESFVVEALSLSGYSGSPVLAFRLHLETPFMGRGIRVSMGELGDRPLSTQQGSPGTPSLLGIDWGHFHDEAEVLQPDGTPADEKLRVRQNQGFAGVVPAWKISEILRSEELDEMRKEQSEKIKREKVDTTLDVAGERPEEFERFEDLTRKLVNTPKSEVDEKRKDEG